MQRLRDLAMVWLVPSMLIQPTCLADGLMQAVHKPTSVRKVEDGAEEEEEEEDDDEEQ